MHNSIWREIEGAAVIPVITGEGAKKFRQGGRCPPGFRAHQDLLLLEPIAHARRLRLDEAVLRRGAAHLSTSLTRPSRSHGTSNYNGKINQILP